jgi:hypothetical protein
MIKLKKEFLDGYKEKYRAGNYRKNTIKNKIIRILSDGLPHKEEVLLSMINDDSTLQDINMLELRTYIGALFNEGVLEKIEPRSL